MNQPVNSIDVRPAAGSAPHPCGAGPLVPGSQSPSHQVTQLPSYPVPQSPGRNGAGEPGHKPTRSQSRLERKRRVPKPRKSRRISQPRLTREERAAMRRLRERNARQWIDAVRRASRAPAVRAALASALIWDYFMDNPAAHMRERALLLKWSAEWTLENDPAPAVLARALQRLGFPKRVAELRSRVGE